MSLTANQKRLLKIPEGSMNHDENPDQMGSVLGAPDRGGAGSAA